MVVKKPVNIFTFINQIFYKNKTHPYDKKLAPAYQLSRWLAHDPQLIDIVQEMNFRQFKVPDEKIYEYYFHKVPKGRRYIKWNKAMKVPEKVKKDIQKIKENYGVSMNEAKRIHKHLESIRK